MNEENKTTQENNENLDYSFDFASQTTPNPEATSSLNVEAPTVSNEELNVAVEPLTVEPQIEEAPTVNVEPQIEEAPTVNTEPQIENVTNEATIAPAVEENPVGAETPQADIPVVEETTLEQAPSEEKKEEVTSGKSTLIFVVALVIIIAAFIFALKFIWNILG